MEKTGKSEEKENGLECAVSSVTSMSWDITSSNGQRTQCRERLGRYGFRPNRLMNKPIE
jgi:hypothetical protein